MVSKTTMVSMYQYIDLTAEHFTLTFDSANIPRCSSECTHQRSCTRCAQGFAVIAKLKEWLHQKRSEAGMSKLDEHDLGQHLSELNDAHKNLIEYRSHLARQLSESLYDDYEAKNLLANCAVVLSNFKMKILSVFFHENWNKFFGKDGIPCLRFMITYGQAIQTKKVEFVMILTNDTTQDAAMVKSTKCHIYRHLLLTQIDTVYFRSDSAASFNCDFAHAC